MAAVTPTHIRQMSPNPGLVMLKVELPATTDNADTFTVTLGTYGMDTFEGIVGFTHSTTDSVVITEDPTTSVSAGVLTVTVGGSTANKKRVFIIYGDSVP